MPFCPLDFHSIPNDLVDLLNCNRINSWLARKRESNHQKLKAIIHHHLLSFTLTSGCCLSMGIGVRLWPPNHNFCLRTCTISCYWDSLHKNSCHASGTNCLMIFLRCPKYSGWHYHHSLLGWPEEFRQGKLVIIIIMVCYWIWFTQY